MDQVKIPKFYVDKDGSYDGGLLKITHHPRWGSKNRPNLSVVEIFYKNKPLIFAHFDSMHLILYSIDGSIEEMTIINEALRQMDGFRSLLLVERNGKRMLITEGQRIPFISGIEIYFYADSIYTALPFKSQGNKKFVRMKPDGSYA